VAGRRKEHFAGRHKGNITGKKLRWFVSLVAGSDVLNKDARSKKSS
jgi:hypothetical protein